jgi:hypothetical protein
MSARAHTHMYVCVVYKYGHLNRSVYDRAMFKIRIALPNR